MTYAFDFLEFTQRLEQVDVEREQAVAHAELARDMFLVDVASKADLTFSRRSMMRSVNSNFASP